jgi:hypothetical protein
VLKPDCFITRVQELLGTPNNNNALVPMMEMVLPFPFKVVAMLMKIHPMMNLTMKWRNLLNQREHLGEHRVVMMK